MSIAADMDILEGTHGASRMIKLVALVGIASRNLAICVNKNVAINVQCQIRVGYGAESSAFKGFRVVSMNLEISLIHGQVAG